MDEETNQILLKSLTPEDCGTITLNEWQERNEFIYGSANRFMFSPMRMTMRIGRFAGRLHKAIEVENFDQVEHHSALAFSWVLGTSNKLSICLAKALYQKFPHACPHCNEGPCGCFGKNEENSVRPAMPATLDEFQNMFAWLYPRNILRVEQGKIVEEVFELQEAMDNYTGAKVAEDKKPVISELCDVAAHLFGIANCSKFKLSTRTCLYFSEGCYECHQPSCICPFPRTTTVSPRRLKR